MSKICTSLDQSKRLIELGIDIKTADMYYWCGSDLNIGGYNAIDEELDIPAWSLSALLELLPDKIQVNNENYYLNLHKNGVEYRGPITWDGQKCVLSFGGIDLINAVFQAISFLLVNGKI